MIPAARRGRAPVAVAIPVIVPRALVVWGLTRLAFAALPLAIGEPFGSISPSPITIVPFAGVVGLIDVLIRKEWILWADLGVTPALLFALYAVAAVPAEWILALMLR